jgi:hypothetical protein
VMAAAACELVLPPQWRDGAEHVMVVGHHRGTRGRGLVRMVISRRHLTRFRVQASYSPAVIHAPHQTPERAGLGPPPRLWDSRQQAEHIAAVWAQLDIKDEVRPLIMKQNAIRALALEG